MSKLFVHSFTTKLGRVHIAATEKGLALVSLPGESDHWFDSQVEKQFPRCQILSANNVCLQAEKEIRSFLAGKLKRFTVRLDMGGTSFQKKVFKQVARIPYGTTMSYGDIARAVGHPRACRAVGTVNARNKLPLFIPCHRVVASNGIGGYGGGLSMKKRLLKLEGAL